MNPFILYPGQPRPPLGCEYPGKCLYLIDGPVCVGPYDCPYLVLLKDKPPAPVDQKSARYTREQIEKIIAYHGKISVAGIASMIGRTEQSVNCVIWRLRKMGKIPERGE